MSFLKRTGALALGAVLVLGCTSEIGTNFDLSRADQFKPGVTTYTDAVAQLGKPTSLRRQADGRFAAGWRYAKGTTLSGGSAKSVAIVFSADGIMERVASRAEVGQPE